MMLKALPLVHFWSVLLLKEQMMASVRKTLKTLVWWAQNRSISSEICPENNHEIRCFFTDCFPAKFAPKMPAKSADFSTILSQKIPWNLTFFRDLSEALLRIMWHNLLQWTVKADLCFLCVIVTVVNSVNCFKRNVLYCLSRQIKVTHVFKKQPSLHPSSYSMNSWSVCLFVLL